MKKIYSLILGMLFFMVIGSNVEAYANWESYFGCNNGWYEAASGSEIYQNDDKWKVHLDEIGYGGCWGAQMINKNVNVKKGKTYKIRFNIESTDCDKLIFFRISNYDNIAYGYWIQLKKGKKEKYCCVFEAACDANSICFGLGGDLGDGRSKNMIDETNINTKYDELIYDANALSSTSIECESFLIEEYLTKYDGRTSINSIKKNNKNKMTVKIRKMDVAINYEVQVSDSAKFPKKKSKIYKTKSENLEVKGLKKNKTYYVRARTNCNMEYSKGIKTIWSPIIKLDSNNKELNKKDILAQNYERIKNYIKKYGYVNKNGNKIIKRDLKIKNGKCSLYLEDVGDCAISFILMDKSKHKKMENIVQLDLNYKKLDNVKAVVVYKDSEDLNYFTASSTINAYMYKKKKVYSIKFKDRFGLPYGDAEQLARQCIEAGVEGLDLLALYTGKNNLYELGFENYQNNFN